MWLHKRSVARGAVAVADSWVQLPCLSVEVRSAALLPTTAITSAVMGGGRLLGGKDEKRLFFCHTGNKRNAVGILLLIGFPLSIFAFLLLPGINSSPIFLLYLSPLLNGPLKEIPFEALFPYEDILTSVMETESSLKLTIVFFSK